MCGIAGSYHLGAGPPPADPRIHAALGRIAHRGPDDEGVHRAGRAELGHRRLRIIDPSPAGHQPFTDSTGRYTLAFNGEAFNFRELRSALEAQGHRFRSRTDTEAVLQLLIAKGEAALHEINGFFALAFHDAELDTLLLARDRLGVKPLWWCQQGSRLLFASELRALEALGADGPLDAVSLRQYLAYHYIPAPHGIRHGANKLCPGELLRVSAAGVERARWYDLPAAAGSTPPPPRPAEPLHALLDDAVRLRLAGDAPLGAFLSGGLDSSIVCALAARHEPGLRTFSIGFSEHPYYDETPHAERMARHIGSDHRSIRLSDDELAAAYTGLLEAIDEPFADSSALPAWILCREASRQVAVALSGDGADEVFGGYRKHQAELRMAHPGPLEKAVVALAPLWRALPRSRTSALADAFRKLHRFASAAKGDAAQRWLALASPDADGDAPALVPLTARAGEMQAREAEMARGVGQMPGLNGALLADALTVLHGDMLQKMDLAGMAHGLEVRSPFLDRRVVELAFALPAEVKVRRGTGKAILREAFGHLLPPEALARRKRGFEVPLRSLLLGPLASLQEELLRDELVREAGLEPAAVRAVRKRLRSPRPGQAEATTHALIVYMAWWKARFA